MQSSSDNCIKVFKLSCILKIIDLNDLYMKKVLLLLSLVSLLFVTDLMACIKKYLGDADNITYYTYNSEKAFRLEDSR